MPIFFVSTVDGRVVTGSMPTVRAVRQRVGSGYHFGEMLAERVARLKRIADDNYGATALSLAATIMAATGSLPKAIREGAMRCEDTENKRMLSRLEKAGGWVRGSQLYSKADKKLTVEALDRLVAHGLVEREERTATIRSKYKTIWYRKAQA